MVRNKKIGKYIYWQMGIFLKKRSEQSRLRKTNDA